MSVKRIGDSEEFILNFWDLKLSDIKKLYSIAGIGSSRYVFSLNKDLVFKYAYRRAGIMQSQMEYDIYNGCNEQCRRILCPIIELRDKILIMKRALPLNKALEHWGIRESVDGNILMYLNSISMQIYFSIEEVENGIRELSSNYGLLYEDLIRIRNWGVLNGKLVLIDYGCNKNLYLRYYAH